MQHVQHVHYQQFYLNLGLGFILFITCANFSVIEIVNTVLHKTVNS